jgi:hypothetical protein
MILIVSYLFNYSDNLYYFWRKPYHVKYSIYTLLLIAVTITSCSKNEPQANLEGNVTLHYDETHQLVLTNTPTTNVTWKSSDESIGTVDNSGLFTAKKVGTVTITASGSKFKTTADVTITPYSTLCKEPALDLGKSQNAIKLKETRALANQSSDYLYFYGENSKLRYSSYHFIKGQLAASALFLANREDVVKEAVTFFKERYTLLEVDGNTAFFSYNSILTIGLTVDSNLGFIAIYYPNYATFQVANHPTLNELKALNTEAINRLKAQDITSNNYHGQLNSLSFNKLLTKK